MMNGAKISMIEAYYIIILYNIMQHLEYICYHFLTPFICFPLYHNIYQNACSTIYRNVMYDILLPKGKKKGGGEGGSSIIL